jgi:hypothetical protein
MTGVKTMAAVTCALVLGAGCTTMTGRPAMQWVEDKATTAKVKTALVASQPVALTRVDVDTFDNTVYLTGRATDPEAKQRVEDTARRAAGGREVVSHVQVEGARGVPAASPATSTQAMGAGAPRFSRVEPLGGASDRFAAYDQAGKRVATVVNVTPGGPGVQREATFRPAENDVDHVSMHPQGDRGITIVLWHISPDEAARLAR